MQAYNPTPIKSVIADFHALRYQMKLYNLKKTGDNKYNHNIPLLHLALSNDIFFSATCFPSLGRARRNKLMPLELNLKLS